MKRAQDETGGAKLFSANITADDHYKCAPAPTSILEAFGPDADKVAFLVDGYLGPQHGHHRPPPIPQPIPALPPCGPRCRDPSAKRGYTAFVLIR